ncbi:MAG TPA: GNAT family N-acetyltransferase [Actinomycetota bacterium]
MILSTARLELRASAPEYLDGLWHAMEVSWDALAPWMAWAVEPTKDGVRDFLERAAAGWRDAADRHFTIFTDGEATGQCSLHKFDQLANSAEIGYWIRSDLCGSGVATEAAAALVRYGFDEMKVHRIELRAGTGNVASNRIAAKLGFRIEGVARAAGFGAGGHYDMNVYGLLATDGAR